MATNVRLWTRREIDRLVETFVDGGDMLALNQALDRTHEAVLARANRLRLKHFNAEVVRRESSVAISG